MNLKQNFIGASLLLIVFIVLGIYYEKKEGGYARGVTSSQVTTVDTGRTSRYTSETGHNDRAYSIAIMVPTSHPALDKITEGFIETINKERVASGHTSKIKAKFYIYNAQANRTLMRAQAEEIVSQNYDLIFTVGAACSLMAQEITNKKSGASPQKSGVTPLIPIVFGCVADSAKNSFNAPNITGITESRNYQQQCDLLLLLKPDIKTGARPAVLLVYDPTQGAGLAKDKETVEQIFKSKNINLKTIEIDKASSLMTKVAGALSGIDVLLMFKDNTVVSGIETLVNLCNRNKITLYASDLDSGSKGAALSYGAQEYDYGKESAYVAISILRDHKTPAEIPIRDLNKFHIRVNQKTASLQNLEINKDLLFLIKAGQIV